MYTAVCYVSDNFAFLYWKIIRRALGRAHVPPTKVFRRLAVNKTI